MLLQQPLSLSSPSLSFPHFPTHWSPPHRPRLLTPIRMGGGPRTFPGGVSKWQWKRMQAKKSKQLLKARLLRERQLYEMRKRSELKAAVAQLEKPWELVEKAPTIFSASADEQVKALADRFQKPGGFDMWSERDGPRVIKNGEFLPSHRFFPKGVVHGVRPYGVEVEVDGDGDGDGFESFDDWIARGGGGGGVRRSSRRRRERREGVRGNAEEKTDCIDVKGEVVDGRGMNQLSFGNLKVLNNDGGWRNGRSLGTSSRGRGGENNSFRSTRDLGYGESVDMDQLGYENSKVLEKVVDGRGDLYRGMDQLSLGNSKGLENDNGGRRNLYGSGSDGNGRSLGSSRRGGGKRQFNGEKSALRSTRDLSYENSKGLEKVDGRRNSYSSGSGGNGRRHSGRNR